MGEWGEFAKLRQFHLTYRSILLGTFLLTVVFDLTVAVEVGLAMACRCFIYRMSTLFRVVPLNTLAGETGGEPMPARVQAFGLYGALFFGAVGKVEDIDEMLRPDTEVVVLSLHHLISMDTSGLDALVQLRRHCERKARTLVLCELNAQPLSLIQRSHQDELFGPANLHASLAAGLDRARVVTRRSSV
jgi:SulP family sulfate permease